MNEPRFRRTTTQGNTGGFDLYVRSFDSQMIPWPALLWHKKSLCVASRVKRLNGKRRLHKLFDTQRFSTSNLWEPQPPQASYPTLALPGWNNLTVSSCGDVISWICTQETYLYLKTSSLKKKMFLQYSSNLRQSLAMTYFQFCTFPQVCILYTNEQSPFQTWDLWK